MLQKARVTCKRRKAPHSIACTASRVSSLLTTLYERGLAQQRLVSDDLVKGCPDTFIQAPQKILVGQNKLTVDKPSFDECIKSCLNSQKENGFVCKSAMFYYNASPFLNSFSSVPESSTRFAFQDQKLNCILNTESSKTKPDLYTDAAAEDKEIYFEPGCGGGQKCKYKLSWFLTRSIKLCVFSQRCCQEEDQGFQRRPL